MIRENINRFCVLVVEINDLNKKLGKAKADFYDGGHSFEEVYSSDLKELEEKQNEIMRALEHLDE